MNKKRNNHRLFSGKKKRKVLKEKRRLKNEKNKISKIKKSSKNTKLVNPDKVVLVKSFGGLVDTKDKSGHIPSIFQKESKIMVEERRLLGDTPINMSKRKERLLSPVPYYLEEDPLLAHPVRPKWSSKVDKIAHESLEQDYFNEWCERVRSCYKDDKECIIPFENNLDVWRQLWRTIEQSDIILLIVDIRNPLLHIPPSLVNDVVNNHKKKLVVVLTKIDLVSRIYVQDWIRYLKSQFPEIEDFIPFTKQPVIDDSFDPSSGGVASRRRRLKKKPKKNDVHIKAMVDNILNVCTKGFTFDKTPLDEKPGVKREAVVTIGCVGHPNVGKSSVLNSIIGTKVLSVSRTAGHTKHLQHIFLDDPYGVCVMDCPGLIFPMRQPRYMMELCGLCPIAQIRETMSAIRFLAENIKLENLYVLKMPDWYDKGSEWTPLSICEALGDKRGYTLSRSCGAPDVHRAGLEIIRDCVDGIVCLCFQHKLI